jgi:hypothetical protein
MPDLLRRQTARLARAVKIGDKADEAAARRDLLAEKIVAYAEREAAKAGPLTEEQCSRIVAILRPVQLDDEAGES